MLSTETQTDNTLIRCWKTGLPSSPSMFPWAMHYRKGSGALLVMLYKDITKSWDTWNWVLMFPVLHSSRIAFVQGCGILFHMLTIWFFCRHFGMESVPDPLCFWILLHHSRSCSAEWHYSMSNMSATLICLCYIMNQPKIRPKFLGGGISFWPAIQVNSSTPLVINNEHALISSWSSLRKSCPL